MNVLELSEQEIGRRQSLQELRNMGINPYPAAEYPTNAFSTDIKADFKDDEDREVVIAGRMMSRRVMGKASFAELQDSKGRIQVYITRDDICPGENKDLYNNVFKRLLDIGDFIGVKGKVFRTQTGEISVHASELTLLSKSLKPLPIVKYKDGVAYDKFDDPELRYRQRYVDLVVNEGVKDTFLKRATIIRTLRSILDNAGYTEVEELISKSLQEGQFKLIVIDSLSALTGDVYLDLDENRNSTENRVGFDAQMTSRLLKKLNALKTDYDCIFFCINQTRVDLSNPWQASFKSTGGQAVKFFPDVRLFMKRDKVIYDQATLLTGATDKATVGATTTIEAIKSRLGQGFIKYPMTIYFGKGISNLAAYVSLLELPTVVNSKGVTVLEHVTKVTNVLHLDSGDYQSTKGANGLVLLIKEHWDEVEKICFNYVTNYFHEQHTVSEDTDYDERDDLTYEENKLVDYTADDTEDLDSAG